MDANTTNETSSSSASHVRNGTPVVSVTMRTRITTSSVQRPGTCFACSVQHHRRPRTCASTAASCRHTIIAIFVTYGRTARVNPFTTVTTAVFVVEAWASAGTFFTARPVGHASQPRLRALTSVSRGQQIATVPSVASTSSLHHGLWSSWLAVIVFIRSATNSI